jgi:hypothetical protein
MRTILTMPVNVDFPVVIRVKKDGNIYEVTSQEGEDLEDGIDIRYSLKEAHELAISIAKYFFKKYSHDKSK